MAKKTNKPYKRDLGVFPKLPTKTIPNTGQSITGDLAFDFVLEQSKKLDDNMSQIKKLMYHYEWIGRQQINKHRDDIVKKFNLAYGHIDVDDYVKATSEYKAELTMLGGEELDFDLKFYPIIPNIVNSLTSELSKHYVNYSAIAVNPEATSQILEEKNNVLRQLLLQPLQAQFDEDMSAQGIDPKSDAYQQQLKLFQEMPKVQKYFSKEYRLEIEKWANHQLQLDERRFKMKDIEKQAMFNKLVTDLPYVHINLLEDDYKPEIIDPRYAYYLRSPYTQDISDGVMFGWFEFESPINLITRWGSKLKEEDIEKLEHLHIHYKTLLTMDSKARYNLDTPGILESAQNHLAFRELANTSYKDQRYRGDEWKERLVEVSNLYVQVPRKLGKLTMKIGEEIFSSVVDDGYKVSITPTYDTSLITEKSVENLVYGEHIEWFYINELWRCAKINLSTNPNPDNSDDIWVILEKYPIQLPKLGAKFGSYIPVHGGPQSNRYNKIHGIVDKCKNWQVNYNFVYNRVEQLLKGEIGKFYAMNQNLIPQESMGEEWGVSNLVKWAMTARDTKIGPTDLSLANTGGTNVGLSGGFGQIVDLTVTEEVLQKIKLAEVFKNECLLAVGISPQFLGDVSPSETATGVTQGINRSSGQIKYIYDEHFSVFEKVRQTFLECAKYFALKSGGVEQTYVNDEGERQIFRIGSDFLLHQLGVFVTSGLEDNILIENMKNFVLSDNTIGADVLDKMALVSSKSISEIYSKLKDVAIEREGKEKQQREFEGQQQQALLDAQEKQLQMKLQNDNEQKELDRESNERMAQMRVIGASSFSEGTGYEELVKLQELQNKQDNHYRDMLTRISERESKQGLDAASKNQAQADSNLKAELEREKMQLEREKILAKLKESQNNLAIAKVNK